MWRWLAVCVLVVELGGCVLTVPIGGSDESFKLSTSELAFQIAHGSDFAQSVTIARRPAQYSEVDPLTSLVLGAHPTVAHVEGYWAVTALAHVAISSWLECEAAANGGTWYDVRDAWYAASTGWSLYDVMHNEAIGLSLFGGGQVNSPSFVSVPRLGLLNGASFGVRMR